MNDSDSKMSAALRSQIRGLASAAENEYACTMEFDPGFTGFEGHFEGNPIVPGVGLIEAARVAAEEVLKTRLCTPEIGQCRFRRPIFAGESADLKFRISPLPEPGSWKVQAEFRVGEAPSAQMRLKMVKP